jgi:hypothetical protein
MSKASFLPFELGFDHFHIVDDVSRAVAPQEAYDTVLGWGLNAMLFHENIETASECAAWLFIRVGEDGEPVPEAVQFVSMRPDLIQVVQH